MSRYKFNLKPLTPYSFGGNKTFGDPSNGTDITNYHSVSLTMPQQTTVIGFLRFEVLRALDLLGSNKKDAAWDEAIGTNSFRLNKNNSFGYIKQISPVCLSNGNDYFLPAPFEYFYQSDFLIGKEKTISRMIPQLSKNGIMNQSHCDLLENIVNQEITGVLSGEAYSGKNPRCELFVNRKGMEFKLALKDNDANAVYLDNRKIDLNNDYVFQPVIRVGNKKSINLKSNEMEGNFFMQTFYQLRNEMKFTFFADVDLPNGVKFSNNIVKMGGEQSVFKLEVTEIQSDSDSNLTHFNQLFTRETFNAQSSNNTNRIVITSDCLITKELLDKLQFANCNYVPFNYISGNNKVNNFAKLNAGRTKMDSHHYILKRGSVLYPKEMAEFVKAFVSFSGAYNYTEIGFNHFVEC